jgi:UrcA family protein
MTPLPQTICIAAVVSVAALATTGAASSAQAEPQTVRIQLDDLDLKTPQGRAAFEFRLSRAETRLCEDRGDLHATQECQRAVRKR